jgi:hypothetical protein
MRSPWVPSRRRLQAERCERRGRIEAAFATKLPSVECRNLLSPLAVVLPAKLAFRNVRSLGAAAQCF